jgi:hypothetical protein
MDKEVAMDLKEACAASDEMLIRILCASYGLKNERGLDMDDGATAAILVTAALRFAVALATAHGGSADWLHGRIEALMQKQPLGLTNPDDPGVRRWTEQFRQTWGSNVPFAYAMRDDNEPLQ